MAEAQRKIGKAAVPKSADVAGAIRKGKDTAEKMGDARAVKTAQMVLGGISHVVIQDLQGVIGDIGHGTRDEKDAPKTAFEDIKRVLEPIANLLTAYRDSLTTDMALWGDELGVKPLEVEGKTDQQIALHILWRLDSEFVGPVRKAKSMLEHMQTAGGFSDAKTPKRLERSIGACESIILFFENAKRKTEKSAELRTEPYLDNEIVVF